MSLRVPHPAMAAPPDSPASSGPARTPPAVHAAEIYCEHCGRPTEHRVLRLDPSRASGDATIQGVARCRECHLTHPFRSEAERTIEVKEVVSEGPRSRSEVVRLPERQRLQVGSGVPGHGHLIHKIDRKDGRSVSEARAEQVATLWVTSDSAARVPVSIVEGRRTHSVVLVLPSDRVLEVGAPVTVEARTYTVRAIRAQRRTAHEPGTRFPARLVERVYAGRTAMPPAGSSDWTRDRERPSDDASSTSSAGRSRSSPGETKNRGRPRARNAEGGAAHHSVRP